MRDLPRATILQNCASSVYLLNNKRCKQIQSLGPFIVIRVFKLYYTNSALPDIVKESFHHSIAHIHNLPTSPISFNQLPIYLLLSILSSIRFMLLIKSFQTFFFFFNAATPFLQVRKRNIGKLNRENLSTVLEIRSPKWRRSRDIDTISVRNSNEKQVRFDSRPAIAKFQAEKTI